MNLHVLKKNELCKNCYKCGFTIPILVNLPSEYRSVVQHWISDQVIFVIPQQTASCDQNTKPCPHVALSVAEVFVKKKQPQG